MSLLSRQYPSVLSPEVKATVQEVISKYEDTPSRTDTLISLFRLELDDTDNTLDLINRLQALKKPLLRRRKTLIKSLEELEVPPAAHVDDVAPLAMPLPPQDLPPQLASEFEI